VIQSLLAGEQVQTLFPSLMPREPVFIQRFCHCDCEADEASEGISATGAENTRSFSSVEFHESGEQWFQVLISLDYRSCRRKARLLLYPYAGTEIAQPSSRRRRLNLVANEAFATATVPNISKNQWLFLKIGECSYDKQNWYSDGPNEGPS
jgi:hypothetical protein